MFKVLDTTKPPPLLRHFQSATGAIRYREITFESEKNLEFVKTQKWSKLNFFYKLGPEICTAVDFWEGKLEQPEVRATQGLSYSRTKRTLTHQTLKCGYWHLNGGKVAFFDILFFNVKYLLLSVYENHGDQYMSNIVRSRQLKLRNIHPCLFQKSKFYSNLLFTNKIGRNYYWTKLFFQLVRICQFLKRN